MVNLSKKICLLISFFIFVLFVSISSISLAITQEECERKIGKEELSPDELKECEKTFSELRQESRVQQKTLSSAISYLDNTIKLTAISIAQSEKKLEALEEEIAKLSLKIGRLDESLETVSQVLLLRIVETYKKAIINPLYLFLSADGFSQFLSRYQYLKIIQAHDRQLLYQMEQARFDYDTQKTLKEEKQEEIEAIKITLERQKSALAQQKKDKERLLEITRNDEKRYQDLLAKAKAQLSKLKSFTAGRNLISPVDLQDDWGKYYSQLDSRWAETFLGNSGDQIWEVGCLVTSVAMVWTHFGENITPSAIAADSGNFSPVAHSLLNRPWVPPPGHSWVPYGGRTTRVSEEWIKKELADGHPVIVGLIITPGNYADHFVVAREVDGEGNLLISDPLVPKLKIKLRDQYPGAALVNAASYH